jgi:hypothetical protein
VKPKQISTLFQKILKEKCYIKASFKMSLQMLNKIIKHNQECWERQPIFLSTRLIYIPKSKSETHMCSSGMYKFLSHPYTALYPAKILWRKLFLKWHKNFSHIPSLHPLIQTPATDLCILIKLLCILISFRIIHQILIFLCIIITNSWPYSASELSRPRPRCLSAKLVPTLADRGCHVVSAADPLRP